MTADTEFSDLIVTFRRELVASRWMVEFVLDTVRVSAFASCRQ